MAGDSGSSPGPSPSRHDKDEGSAEPNSRIAHTLTACCRCRQRKTRCDPGLPRCGPCERVKAHCEYFDPARGIRIPRNYVVHLQHRVAELQSQLEGLERDDFQLDPEEIVRGGADVKINKEDDDSKFLGPSSGIAITRLVMELAKRFTHSDSINDIVAPNQAEQAKETFAQEEVKPTSKVYPIISNVAAPDLPPRDMTDVLVKLFNVKVMTMYPFFHEPAFWQDVEDVYNGSRDPFQNFAVRMVIAISLQRYDTQFAGLADSFYLAALGYMEEAIKPMNVRTIQCFCLIGSYSLLTPTRTAVYYVVGLATRLCQALGLSEEKTIIQGPNGQRANPLEIDMRRRLFWSVISMEYGLAHSMGRPSSFATSLDHIDVQWFELVEDKYLTTKGVMPNAPRSYRKWICIHFMKMRLLQVEIRRTLYQKKRPEPLNDSHPWFATMEKKLKDWRDATPNTDAGTGLDAAWFIGRYHIMEVHMFRPSPQCPRPSLNAAQRCFAASKSNIYMHQAQIQNGNVDMTWIFTLAMFMTINTILWTLSYEPVRKEHPREEVEADLNVAMECIRIASERWPGVESALELYKTLISACMRIYDKEGDVDIAAGSPIDTSTTGAGSRSNTASPVAQQVYRAPPPLTSTVPPTDLNSRVTAASNTNGALFSTSLHRDNSPSAQASRLSPYSSMVGNQSASARSSTEFRDTSVSSAGSNAAKSSSPSYGNLQLPLPATYNELGGWNPDFDFTTAAPRATIPALAHYEPRPPMSTDFHSDGISPDSSATTSFGNERNMPFNLDQGHHNQGHHNQGHQSGDSFPQWADYYFQPPEIMANGQGRNSYEFGLTQEDQMELMESLRANGTDAIQNIVDATNRVFYPPQQLGHGS